MLIYDVLKRDHETIQHLLQQLQDSSDSAVNSRHELVERLRDELVPHARAEEKVLYDTLKEISGTEDMALEGYEEHSTAESLLRDLELAGPSDDLWQVKLRALKEAIEHHVREEELMMFENARQVLATEEAHMMTEAYLNLKEQVRNGAVMPIALESIAKYMPARFAQRFAELGRRYN